MVVPTRKSRSVSQLNTYEQCPYRYYLERIAKAWQRPAAWLPHGSAVHEAIEMWERSGRTMTLEEVLEVFRAAYQRYTNEQCEQTPNFEFWFRSGPYAGQVDVERRHRIGQEMVKKYMDWAESHPEEEIWTAPDGTPGIELEFKLVLGGVPIRGFIDAILQIGDEVRVRDHKTGATPGKDFQLGVYGLAIAETYGIEQPQLGDYWMGKSGKPTHPYPIGDWTLNRVTEKFVELDENIEAERFDPVPDPDKCRFCPVRTSCDYAVG